jgi:hypothetical protein
MLVYFAYFEAKRAPNGFTKRNFLRQNFNTSKCDPEETLLQFRVGTQKAVDLKQGLTPYTYLAAVSILRYSVYNMYETLGM